MDKKPTYDELDKRVKELEKESLRLKRAVVEMHREKEKFRILVEQLPMGVSIIKKSKEGHYEYINPKFIEMFGHTLEDIPTGKKWFRKAYPDPENRNQVISTWITDHKEFKVGEARPRIFTVTCKDGSEKVIHFIPVTMESGDQFVIYEDITERQQVEEALRKSEEKYRTIFESIEEGYFEVDLDGNLTFFNDSLCKIVGYSREELIGMNNRDYTTPETAKRMYQLFKQVYRTGKPVKIMDYKIIRKDRNKIVLELSASLMRDSSGQPIMFRGIVRDVTERKRAIQEKKGLEAQLRQSQKMESIGNIASGTAHNFKNILAEILVNIQIIQGRYEYDPKLYELSGRISSSVEKGTRLVRSLMQFSRKPTGDQFKILNLSLLINDTCGLVSQVFGKNIEISVDLPEMLPIMGDHFILSQVFMNLCINARDAMPNGGRLKAQAMQKEDRVEVIISDTGHGMDTETLERCFDPFFTTKDAGKGTGLGLSTTYGIIKDHGGEIHVSSEIDKGTTFKLYFPLASAAVE